MSYKIPQYISSANVRQPPSYKWPENGGVNMFEEKENPKTGHAIWFTTYRARFAVQIAITEWTSWRFEGLSENFELVCHFVESMWAADIDRAYFDLKAPANKEFIKTGNCNEPMFSAMRELRGHYRGLFQTNRSGYVTTSLLLAAHVLPDKKPYGIWLNSILDRMKEHHYYDPGIDKTDEELEMPRGDERIPKNGLPIPRIAFDPEHEYNPDNSPALLHEYLQNLDHTQNPFLVSPERMLEQGFVGTPYTYPPKG